MQHTQSTEIIEISAKQAAWLVDLGQILPGKLTFA